MSKHDLSVVESIGLANGHDAAADFWTPVRSARFKTIFQDIDESLSLEMWKETDEELDPESVTDLLNQAADAYNTGWDTSAVMHYRVAFRRGFAARVWRDATVMLID